MQNLKQEILRLAKISSDLEPSLADRQKHIEKISGFTNGFIDNLSTTPAYSDKTEKSNSLAINPNRLSLEEIIELYKEEVSKKGINPASGGHLGYIPGGGIHSSALADFLVAITNDYVGMYFSSPGGTTIEFELLNWMKEVFGFPENAVGNLTSGGSIANLIALTAARDKYGIKNEKVEKSVIYLSEQVHHCIQKSLRIIGLEDVIIRYIKLDEYFRMSVDHLEEQIKTDLNNKLNPYLIIASAGTTDTGAIDPLEKIGNLSKQYKLWFHIDGAYGGFFMLVDKVKEKFKGLDMADSLVIDPHKGLFLPYGLGAVLVKDRESVYKSHVYRANYMQDALDETNYDNPADVSPELTRHFRSLRLWLPLQLHGIEPFKACLEEKLLLTSYFRELLIKNGFKVGPEPDLSVSYFWFPFTSMEQNEGNKMLLKNLHKDGEIFFSSTMINGKFVIRIAILSFRTKLETIDKAMDMLNRNLELIRKKIK